MLLLRYTLYGLVYVKATGVREVYERAFQRNYNKLQGE